MSYRYIVIGGDVFSQHDGQVHYIGCAQLARLYDVRSEDCYMVPSERAFKHFSDIPKNVIILRPREDGNYERPEVTR